MDIRPLKKYTTKTHNASQVFMVTKGEVFMFDTHLEFYVPERFVSDGASIPKIFHSFISPISMITASIAHDYMYREGSDFKGNRKEADQLLRNLLKEEDKYRIGPFQRFFIYWFVRIFGSKSWKDKGMRDWGDYIAESEKQKEKQL